ncbi:MAG: MotA/TolQ/ExbB proton channel family protein [Neomegalonema sp.]|nr:MotA/TolQ/ExbB proton channel family protein [Neomegalonema sp.]
MIDVPTVSVIEAAFTEVAGFLNKGGPVGWALGALSVAALAIILWKTWRFLMLGVWRSRRARRALALWRSGGRQEAALAAAQGDGVIDRVVATAMRESLRGPMATAREEVERVGRASLAELRVGLRGLETIATIAPLLGLLGTVLGMIAAFQALQAAGGRADPSTLAGGIWEAMLTTAAGMAVAIPTGLALNWCESVVERARLRIEDAATQVFTATEQPEQPEQRRAA